MNIRLTEKVVKNLPAPNRGNKITYDTEIAGFGVRVTAKGIKSFILNYHVAGRERRMTIGQFPAWTVVAAREEAGKLKRKVDQGIDPLEDRRAQRAAPTLLDLWSEYETRHLPNLAERARKDIRSMWQTYILPKLGNVKLKDLTSRQVDDLHRSVTRSGKYRANRVVENLRSALNLAVRWDWLTKNPADGFRKHAEEPRELYLTEAQITDAMDCLERMENRKAADAIRLLILTGARLGEVLRAEWTHFDLAKGLWTKPSSHTKQKRTHNAPLSPEAVQLLNRIKKGTNSKYAFPSSTGEPMADIKRPWGWLRKELGMPHLRLHDLRHTFASLLISNGVALPVIGKLLGHSQHQTTMRYSHLYDDPLRDAVSQVGRVVRTK